MTGSALAKRSISALGPSSLYLLVFIKDRYSKRLIQLEVLKVL